MNENVFMFYVPGVALPQGSKTAFISKSTGRPIVKDNNIRLPRWRNTVTEAALRRVNESEWAFPITGPIAITVTFIFQRPKSHFGTGRNSTTVKPNSPAWPDVTPDLDKLIRAIFDGITDAQVWRDDAQVVWVQAAKRYADKSPLRGPGVHITIAEAL